MGAYGLYEAIDYTPSRLPPGQTSVTIRSFMAHHQGMSLLSLAYLLLDRPMQRRFDADPTVQGHRPAAAGARARAATPVFPHADRGQRHAARRREEPKGQCASSPIPPRPCPKFICFPTAGITSMISSAGGGYSRWRDLAVTRWREDATRDCWGHSVYHARRRTGEFWSDAYQPTLMPCQALRGDLHAGARRISAARRRASTRTPKSRLPGRRHRAAPAHAHQSHP